MFARQCITGIRRNSYTKFLKAFYSTAESTQHIVNDIEIPVPWGKVTGRLWGSQDKQPLLALHGWQDNAASFDKIAPLIVKNVPVLAIDLPGHGFSSWLPTGFMYIELVYFLLIRRIQKYFGWEQVKVLAHSLSAMVTYWYAATFPKEVQYVIALDFLKFPSIDAAIHATLFENAVNMLFDQEESHTVQRRYSESELIKRGLAGYKNFNLDEELFKVLMTRGTTRKEDGTYVFNRDPKLQVMPIYSLFCQEHLEKYAELIKCPYLIIKGDQTLYGEKKENFYRALDIMKAANDKVYFHTLQSSHHFHLLHPEDTAAIINQFLEKYN